MLPSPLPPIFVSNVLEWKLALITKTVNNVSDLFQIKKSHTNIYYMLIIKITSNTDKRQHQFQCLSHIIPPNYINFKQIVLFIIIFNH